MDEISVKNNEIPQIGGGIDSAEYVQMLNALIISLNSIDNSIKEMRSQFQQLNQLIVQSHNINSTLINNLQTGLIRSMPKAELNFLVGLAEHCNLNCAGCDHFSPLAEKKFADFEETEKDFTRLAELFHGKVRQISFQGGEPLLHPEITKFLVASRKKFSKARIYILTNGTKLLSMPNEFWEVCRDNNIEICPTKYPIPFDYDAAKNKVQANGVKFEYFGDEEVVKTLYKTPLDLRGLQDGRTSFLNCFRANQCIYLQNGRLYTCTIAPTVKHFDKKFGTNLFDEELNSIDIYKANSAEEILEFLAKPIPFCRYCKSQETVYGIIWHKSNKTIDEWT